MRVPEQKFLQNRALGTQKSFSEVQGLGLNVSGGTIRRPAQAVDLAPLEIERSLAGSRKIAGGHKNHPFKVVRNASIQSRYLWGDL